MDKANFVTQSTERIDKFYDIKQDKKEVDYE